MKDRRSGLLKGIRCETFWTPIKHRPVKHLLTTVRLCSLEAEAATRLIL